MAKPKFDKNRKDYSGLNIMSKFDDARLKEYYSELSNTILNLEDSGPKRMYIWYFFHIIPSLFFINNLSNIAWVYQIFWTGSSIGLAYSSYEFYSTPLEKKILDNHILFGSLFCIIIIAFAVCHKLFALHSRNLLNLITILNFPVMYSFIGGKRREFYIPKWFKYSQRKFVFILMLFGIVATYSDIIKGEGDLESFYNMNKYNNLEEGLKVTNEQISLIHYRYLQELSSK